MNRLYRSRQDRVFSGICGGLGEMINVDPNVIRVLVVLAAWCTAVLPVLLTYVIATMVLPAEPGKYSR